jgi:hypothetical protein
VILANDVSRRTVNKAWYTRSTITLKSGPIQAVVLMTGDRGLLLYDPIKNRVSYQRFDDVDKIDWERRFSPFFFD